jgi:hypothetical protein
MVVLGLVLILMLLFNARTHCFPVVGGAGVFALHRRCSALDAKG